MTSLQERVRRAIERDGLIPPGARVLAAVSGGSDSVALLLLLRALAGECGFALAGLAHLNHGLRGHESDVDEAFCRGLAVNLGLPIDIGRRDVATMAREGHVSIEVAARRARYEFFAEAAGRLHADRIATGHTRDDQAETLLLRVLRGAGSTGLAGIRPRRGNVVRPALDFRRDELRTFLASQGLKFRTDSTNRDVSIPRNWVRHRLLPLLSRQLHSDVVEVLAREAAILRDETAFLDDLAAGEATRIERAPTGRRTLALDALALSALPAAIARRVVRHALDRVDQSRFYGFDHVEQVLALAARPCSDGPRGGNRLGADLPGVRMERNGPEVVLYKGGIRIPPAAAFRYAIPVPGRVAVPECGCVIQADVRRWTTAQPSRAQAVGATGNRVAIRAQAAAGGLAVRSRRPGDALQPFGMKGRKKLQDVLVDRKVPRGERDRVPVVVDRDDRILWIGGLVGAEETRVTSRTRGVVILSMSRMGEEGDEA
jgi:tRNA(Ile)-lysidine synthase